ncbi:2-C-methyl-D-erythritol 2,4-cyclodiphosphate synthase [Hydrogenobaculum acidophilum]
MYRIGIGQDAHYFEDGRKLYLGGEEFDVGYGLKGHSDGDALLHAITDAILGALAQTDIGTIFPDKSKENKNRNSVDFLNKALEIMYDMDYSIVNLDCNIIADRPNISSIRDKLLESLSKLLSVPKSNISIKAKTKEGYNKEDSLEVVCIILLQKMI